MAFGKSRDARRVFKSKEGKEALRKGNAPDYHLLNVCELDDFKKDYQVVDFRNVFGVPIDILLVLQKAKKKGCVCCHHIENTYLRHLLGSL